MKTAKQFLEECCKSKGYDTDYESLAETLTEGKTVWSDPDTDQHRWYICQDVVNEVEGVFIKFTDYIITGDNSMSDMDLKYDLDSAKIVTKKTKEVTVTFYE